MITTRFAPSPTGDLHLGGVRTALFAWLHARRHGGAFRLRLDDTDRERSTAQAERSILDGLAWLGLSWDGEVVRQSARASLHADQARALEAAGLAYRCACTPEELEVRRADARASGRAPGYDRRCRDAGRTSGALRFRMPLEGATMVEDLCRGRVTFANDSLEDLVILKADGTPTYNFATVVDDALMGITDIVRGDDLLNSTPKQVLIYRALGHAPPRFAHLPLVLGPGRQRLSKRHGAESVLAYRARGFLPEAVLNAAARLGWSGGAGDREVLSVRDMLDAFALDALTKAPSTFDPAKLDWLNREHLSRLTADELARRVAPFVAQHAGREADPAGLPELAALHLRSAGTLDELGRQLAAYVVDDVSLPAELVAAHVAPHVAALAELHAALAARADFSRAVVEDAMRALAKARGVKLGELAQALRVSLTGAAVSAGVFDVAAALGRARVLARLAAAVALASAARPPS